MSSAAPHSLNPSTEQLKLQIKLQKQKNVEIFLTVGRSAYADLTKSLTHLASLEARYAMPGACNSSSRIATITNAILPPSITTETPSTNDAATTIASGTTFLASRLKDSLSIGCKCPDGDVSTENLFLASINQKRNTSSLSLAEKRLAWIDQYQGRTNRHVKRDPCVRFNLNGPQVMVSHQQKEAPVPTSPSNNLCTPTGSANNQPPNFRSCNQTAIISTIAPSSRNPSGTVSVSSATSPVRAPPSSPSTAAVLPNTASMEQLKLRLRVLKEEGEKKDLEIKKKDLEIELQRQKKKEIFIQHSGLGFSTLANRLVSSYVTMSMHNHQVMTGQRYNSSTLPSTSENTTPGGFLTAAEALTAVEALTIAPSPSTLSLATISTGTCGASTAFGAPATSSTPSGSTSSSPFEAKMSAVILPSPNLSSAPATTTTTVASTTIVPNSTPNTSSTGDLRLQIELQKQKNKGIFMEQNGLGFSELNASYNQLINSYDTMVLRNQEVMADELSEASTHPAGTTTAPPFRTTATISTSFGGSTAPTFGSTAPPVGSPAPRSTTTVESSAPFGSPLRSSTSTTPFGSPTPVFREPTSSASTAATFGGTTTAAFGSPTSGTTSTAPSDTGRSSAFAAGTFGASATFGVPAPISTPGGPSRSNPFGAPNTTFGTSTTLSSSFSFGMSGSAPSHDFSGGDNSSAAAAPTTPFTPSHGCGFVFQSGGRSFIAPHAEADGCSPMSM